MIDLHSHILPGLDHGARSWDEAVEMCRIAVDDGIRTLAATPHVSETFPNSIRDIEAATEELRRRIAAAGVDLEITEGGDYHVDPGLAPEKVLTINGNGRYFLLEFPYQVLPPNADRFIATLVRKGLVPIVTHPERILTLHGHEERLESLLGEGAIIQVTASSVTGGFGAGCRRSAERMLGEGWVHLLASDSHWADERPPILSEGRDCAARIVGMDAARNLVEGNPRAVLEGRDLKPAGG